MMEVRNSMEEFVKFNTYTKRLTLSEVKLLKRNARFMRHEQFQRLVENLKIDGCLTSTPFAVLDDDGKYLVLSGNHRVKAAIAAGIEEADFIVTDDKIEHNQRMAIQLSHNAIAGEDDIALLQELFDSLDSVDARLYSGLDDKSLGLLPSSGIPSISESQLSFQVLAFAFLPNEVKNLEKALRLAMVEPSVVTADTTHLLRFAEYDRFLDALDVVREKGHIKNSATAMSIILDVFFRHAEEVTPEMAKKAILTVSESSVSGPSIDSDATVIQTGEPGATQGAAPALSSDQTAPHATQSPRKKEKPSKGKSSSAQYLNEPGSEAPTPGNEPGSQEGEC